MLDSLVVAFLVGGVMMIAEIAVSAWKWKGKTTPKEVHNERLGRGIVAIVLFAVGVITGLSAV